MEDRVKASVVLFGLLRIGHSSMVTKRLQVSEVVLLHSRNCSEPKPNPGLRQKT